MLTFVTSTANKQEQLHKEGFISTGSDANKSTNPIKEAVKNMVRTWETSSERPCAGRLITKSKKPTKNVKDSPEFKHRNA